MIVVVGAVVVVAGCWLPVVRLRCCVVGGLVVGCGLLAAVIVVCVACWWAVVGRWLRLVGCWLLVVGYLLVVVRCSLCVARCPLPVVRCSLFGVRCSLFVVRYWLVWQMLLLLVVVVC